MVATLLEEGHIKFENIADQVRVARVQGHARQEAAPHGIDQWAWDNPRYGLEQCLTTGRSSHMLSITYHGLRRIEELRDTLRRERVLEDFGVLLSVRYLERDAEDAVGDRRTFRYPYCSRTWTDSKRSTSGSATTPGTLS